MDTGVIFYLLIFGPLLPVVLALGVAIMFGVGYVIHALIGAVVDSVVAGSRPHRERAYIRKHQRDISDL